MKRPAQEVAGGPLIRGRRADVAGRARVEGRMDAVAESPGLRARRSVRTQDVALIADFVEFLSQEDAFEFGPGSIPDPIFRDRLRGRLWRHLVMSRPSDGDERH